MEKDMNKLPEIEYTQPRRLEAIEANRNAIHDLQEELKTIAAKIEAAPAADLHTEGTISDLVDRGAEQQAYIAQLEARIDQLSKTEDRETLRRRVNIALITQLPLARAPTSAEVTSIVESAFLAYH